MKYINQRQSPRIDIRLKCRVSAPGMGLRAEMITENISRSGILVIWKSDQSLPVPAVGDLLTVDVELPSHHGFGRKCIHCQAQVVRVTDPEGESPRVALSVNYMKFRAYRDKISALERLEPAAVGTWMS
jgi:hypothetical protein